MKDVLFTWASLSGENNMCHNRHVCFRFISALESWIQYAPDFRRVLYCDQETYDFLGKIDILKLLDKVEVLDFVDELLKEGLTLKKGSYWALPKVLTMNKVENPTIISDVDVILLDNGNLEELVSEWDSFYYDFYENDAEYIYEHPDFKSTYLRGSRISANAGFTWYSNPDWALEIRQHIFDTYRYLEKEHTYQKIMESEGRESVAGEITMYVEEGTLGTFFSRHPEIKLKGELGITNEYCQHILNKGASVERHYNSTIYWNNKIGYLFNPIEYGEDKIRL